MIAPVRRAGFPTILLALVIGCSPAYDSGGCGPAPRATDASSPSVAVQNQKTPCSVGLEGVHGSDPHLVVSFQCPGESDPFLVAVSIDGVLHSMKEVSGAGYGTTVFADLGVWEPADGNWHVAEVVLDPLNLFPESDESNNRVSTRIRVVAPDAAIDAPMTGFVVPMGSGGDGYTLVTQVFQNTPVDVRLILRVGGDYKAIVRSMHSTTVFSFTDSVTFSNCSDPTYGATVVSVRWTPPGPGTYPVDFKIETRGDTPDDPVTNTVTKTLTVLASSDVNRQVAR